jgi:hypothetical protein
MIAQESPPVLRRCSSPWYHVLRDRRLTDLDTEFEQLAVDPRCTPEQVGAAHPAESDHESPDPLTAARISNAIAKTDGSPDGAIERPCPV